eukprot:CAMPEP_0116020974 /NCGR_PEP_ID=MMETSP0321-20121206/10111_1 /TAXON_ID=163516 /ORGANISM="Leptocylindrus danicus var. danicus, Strain B650" /LENGTH=241 /DNA_ID=CAMNT_0003491757 /DNA_START=68 /DNA_END=796 /DNA_ORIENTATION=+
MIVATTGVRSIHGATKRLVLALGSVHSVGVRNYSVVARIEKPVMGHRRRMLGAATVTSISSHSASGKIIDDSSSKRFKSNHIKPSPKGEYDDPLSAEEEQAEKDRVSRLSDYEKTMELRKLDKDIELLNTYRGINTGELYTFRGKFKALARDYGMGFMAWYWTCWCATGALTYLAIDVGGFEALPLIAKIDGLFGTNVAGSINPQLGNIALALAVNEVLEPVRLPIVVMTTKPVVKYMNRR